VSDELPKPEPAAPAAPAPLKYKVVARPRAPKADAVPTPAPQAEAKPAKPAPSPESLRVKELEGVLGEYAKEATKDLRKEHLKVLEDLSGGDASQLLKLVGKLRSAGMLGAPAAPAKPAQTAPTAAAPKPAPEASGDSAHLTRWRELKQGGLTRQAAAYYAAHELEITRARGAGSTN
jgi:hypothetical protein